MENKELIKMKRLDIRQHDVFISWTGKDRKIKDQIVNYLETHGIKCLESDHNCSGDFRLWSSEAVKTCSVFLLLYTENALNSAYIPVEVEAYKNYEDYENRIVPVCASMALYQSDPWGISEFGSAVIFEEANLSESVLQAILHKVESLLVNFLERVYKEASKPQYMKLIPLFRTKNVADKEFDFSELYIQRRLTELDSNFQSIGKIEAFTEICNGEDIIFISGPAGCGKSRYIDQIRKEANPQTIIISLPCHKVTGSGENLFTDMYKEVARLTGERHFYTEQDFANLLNNRHILLVLDGLDEISTDDGTRRFLTKVEDYYRANTQNTSLIFTSRNRNDANLIAMCGRCVRRFELKKRTWYQIQRLVQNLFSLFGSQGKEEEFLNQIAVLDDEIKTNPLLISQLAIIYDNSGMIPKNIVGIYDAISEIIFKLDRTTEMSDIPENYRPMVGSKILSILKHFCAEQYHLLSKGKEMDSMKVFSHILRKEYAEESKERAAFLVEYLHNRAIMMDGEFYHKMFLEYFAAVNYYEQCFDDYDEIEDYDVIDTLFSHYKDPYWSAVLKFFLEKADSCIDRATTVELYQRMIGQNITDYGLLFDTCRNFTCNKKEAQSVLTVDILKKSVDGTYPAYGPLFWYVPEYNLYEEAVLGLETLKNETIFPKALALVRDVCFMFGQKDTAKDVTMQTDASLLYEKASPFLQGVRKALCELFYTGKTDFIGGADVYPRCFNVAEAKSLLAHGCGISGELFVPFEDELGLYCHTAINEVNGEYIGVVSCSYDHNEIEELLSKKSSVKISGLILNPMDDTQMKYIAFSRRNVKVLYIPENISSYDEDWADQITPVLFCWHSINSNSSRLKMYCRNQVIVPSECEQISSGAFCGFSNLEKVILSEQTKRIGDHAFFGCSSLKEIQLHDSITEIQNSAFENCTSLTQIYIPQGVTSIGNNTFQGCSNLIEIDLPEGITTLGKAAFMGCKKLSQIKLPESITEIQTEAFSGCEALSEIILPTGITTISSKTFEFCNSLKCLQIPENVKTIGGFAFANCNELSEVKMPEELESLGGNVFHGCTNLSKVRIPQNLTEIRGGTFQNCTTLNEIELPAAVTVIGGSAFKNCSSLSRIDLPEGITTIKSFVFEGCQNLLEIRMPKGLQKLGKGVFAACAVELKVYNMPTWANIRDLGLQNKNVSYEASKKVANTKMVQALRLAENAQYKHDRDLVRITIKKEAGQIEEAAFQLCENLQSVVVEKGIVGIGSMAFADCKRLAKVSLPNTIAQIGAYTFKNCRKLSKIELPTQLEYIEDGLFMKCGSLRNIRLPEKLIMIKSRAFSGCVSISKVKIPPSVTAIHNSAFANCKNLSEIMIPDSVEQMNAQVFMGCSNLQEIVLPKKIKSLPSKAFSGCSKLCRVLIPKEVNRIGNSAFAGCESLMSMILPDSITTLETGVFKNCVNLSEVQLSQELRSIPEKTFEGCVRLSQVELPSGVVRIDKDAFKGCVSLEQIQIPSSIRKIEDGAFSGCTGLKSIVISRRFEGDIHRIFGNVSTNVIHYI